MCGRSASIYKYGYINHRFAVTILRIQFIRDVFFFDDNGAISRAVPRFYTRLRNSGRCMRSERADDDASVEPFFALSNVDLRGEHEADSVIVLHSLRDNNH